MSFETEKEPRVENEVLFLVPSFILDNVHKFMLTSPMIVLTSINRESLWQWLFVGFWEMDLFSAGIAC